MKNLELKISINNKKNIINALQKISAKDKGVLNQIDTYFNAKKGRLKTREINNKNFELIYYQRPDTSASKISDYHVIPLSSQDCKTLKNTLKDTNGLKVVVKKERNLWMHKNTRIHIDKVSKLGQFLELETIISKSNSKTATQEHNQLIELLNIEKHKKIKKSYSDLLVKQQNKTTTKNSP